MKQLSALAFSVATAIGISALAAETPAETLLGRAVLDALDEELSGTAARDHVSRLTQLHRVPASPGFHEAIEYIMVRAKSYDLADVHIETFPGDGKTWFGTLLGNRGWRVEGGELSEVSPRPRRIASYDDVRVTVADNSESADVTAQLVDVGAGTSPRDYEGKDVRAKLVLSDGFPGAAHRLAVEERGAVGLVSYNSNQQTGWWRDDADLVRWGHLDARGRHNTFALMISVREARSLQERLAAGEKITLHAVTRARNDDSLPYETLVATIPGTDASAGEIVFSCHLDHEKPGANDNASGCAANLEIARTLRTLVDRKRIPPPRRTIRFVWPSEITGTIAYLTKYPDIAARLTAAVHLDMVGADPFVTKSVLHVTRSPWSIATVTDDVAAIFGRYVIDGAYEGAASGDFARAVRAAGGSNDALWADITPYESGSDHQIYQDGSFGIPAIYLRDWPDIYIHTSKDLPDNIEPTKIKRSAFIAAASGYYLAAMPDRGEALLDFTYAGAYERLAEDARRARARLGPSEASVREADNLIAQSVAREQRRLRSLGRFVTAEQADPLRTHIDQLATSLDGAGRSLRASLLAGRPVPPGAARDRRVPVRAKDLKGPLEPTGEWVQQKAGPAARALAINKIPGSGDVAFEIANLIDGSRTVSEIRDVVSAEFEPMELRAIAEYLDLLARIGAIAFK